MLDLEDIVSTIFFVHCKNQSAKEQFLIMRAKKVIGVQPNSTPYTQ
jgi:hypothetical protein